MQARNKVLVGLLVISLIAILMQFNVTSANNERSYQQLLTDYQQNNKDLKKIELDLADAKRAYEQAQADVKAASSSWSNLVNMLNKIGKEITDQMKYSTVMQRSVALERAKKTINQQELSAKTRQDNVIIVFRDAYLAFWQAANQVELNEKQLTIDEANYKKNEQLYEQGKLSLQEYKKQELTYLESQYTVSESIRNLTEKQQNLNAVVGVSLNANYEPTVWEEQKILTYNPVDKYIEIAFNERLNIKIIEDQIAMNQLNIDTYDKYFSYSSMTDKMQESYDNLKDSNYYLALDLRREKTTVEKELRELYLDITYEDYKIDNMLNKRNDTNTDYLKAKELYRNGSITETEMLQAELNYERAHQDYLMSIYKYNTLFSKFTSLSNAGLNITINNSQSTVNMQGGGR